MPKEAAKRIAAAVLRAEFDEEALVSIQNRSTLPDGSSSALATAGILHGRLFNSERNALGEPSRLSDSQLGVLFRYLLQLFKAPQGTTSISTAAAPYYSQLTQNLATRDRDLLSDLYPLAHILMSRDPEFFSLIMNTCQTEWLRASPMASAIVAIVCGYAEFQPKAFCAAAVQIASSRNVSTQLFALHLITSVAERQAQPTGVFDLALLGRLLDMLLAVADSDESFVVALLVCIVLVLPSVLPTLESASELELLTKRLFAAFESLLTQISPDPQSPTKRFASIFFRVVYGLFPATFTTNLRELVKAKPDALNSIKPLLRFVCLHESVIAPVGSRQEEFLPYWQSRRPVDFIAAFSNVGFLITPTSLGSISSNALYKSLRAGEEERGSKNDFGDTADLRSSLPTRDAILELHRLIDKNLFAGAPTDSLWTTTSTMETADPLPKKEAELSKQILLLQNELLFEHYLRRQHVKQVRDLRQANTTSASRDAELDALRRECAVLRDKVTELQQASVASEKKAQNVVAQNRQWEAKLRSSLLELRTENQALREGKLLTEQENESLKEMLAEKAKEAGLSGARAHALEMKLKDFDDIQEREAQVQRYEERMAALTREAVLVDQKARDLEAADLRIAELGDRVSLLEAEKVRHARWLEERDDRIRDLNAALDLAQAKEGVWSVDQTELTQVSERQKRMLQMQRIVAEEQLKAVNKKYDTARQINIALERRLLDLMSQLNLRPAAGGGSSTAGSASEQGDNHPR